MNKDKLIAEFMDVESYKSTKYTIFVYNENNHRTDIDLHYKSSWDWLIPVVDECYNNNPIECNELSDITHALLDCNIDEVYSSVVVYIQKYNQ